MTNQKEPTSKTSLPLCLMAFIKALSNFCLCFLPEDEINEPLANSIEISKSAEHVKRLDTNDPNGSTVAPISPKNIQEYTSLVTDPF